MAYYDHTIQNSLGCGRVRPSILDRVVGMLEELRVKGLNTPSFRAFDLYSCVPLPQYTKEGSWFMVQPVVPTGGRGKVSVGRSTVDDVVAP